MSDLDIDFDEVRRSLQPVAATSHELRDGSEAHWDGSLRVGDIDKLEQLINTRMKYFRKRMDESRSQLADSIYNYAETVRRAVNWLEVEEDSRRADFEDSPLSELLESLDITAEEYRKSRQNNISDQSNIGAGSNADSQIRHADPTSVEEHLAQLQRENDLPVNRLYQVSTGDSLSPTESVSSVPSDSQSTQSGEHINLAETVLPQQNMMQTGAMKPIIGGQQ